MNSGQSDNSSWAGPPLRFRPDDMVVLNVIDQFKEDQPMEEQQRLVKKLASFLTLPERQHDAQFVMNFLCHLFLKVGPQSSLKKTLWRVLNNGKTDLVIGGLISSMRIILEECAVDRCEEGRWCRRRATIVTNFMYCFESFRAAVTALSELNEHIILFCVEHFLILANYLQHAEKSPLSKDVLINFLAALCKFLLCILQQCKISPKMKKLTTNILKPSQSLTMDETLPLELRGNCAFIMALVMDYLPKSVKTKFLFKVFPCLELVKKENVCQFDISDSPTALICVYAAILVTVPQEVLCETTYNGVPVIVYVFEELIRFAEMFSDKPGQIMIISRAFTSLSKMLNGVPVKAIEPMFTKGLEYVWIYLDHYVENVRHSTETVFQNFTRLAVKHYREGNPMLFKMIQLSVLDLLLSKHTHYVYLTILSAELGSEFLLETFEDLPHLLLNQLGDPTIAQQVCVTYELLMEQHLRETSSVQNWIIMWVEFVIYLLETSEPPSTQFYQRIIKNAFRLEPLVLKSIIHFQYFNKANELSTLLECLRMARKKNMQIELESLDNDAKLWRKLVEFNILDTMMCHQSDEVRVSLLGLIVETHKSTETFTQYELEFLLKFFRYNVTSQEPAVRQDLVALYKKALTRMKDGQGALKRFASSAANGASEDVKELAIKATEVSRSYDRFFRQFGREFLKKGLLGRANHYRRSLCLELMIFMHEIVPETAWNAFWDPGDFLEFEQLFDDNYESNLTLATKLINMISSFKSSSNSFALDIEECLNSFFKAAVSFKPAETTKAANIFLVYLEHPRAMVALEKHSNGTLLPCKNVHELALLVLVQNLEKQIKLAERDIRNLKTFSTPFYGLILTVRYVLRGLPADSSDPMFWSRFMHPIFDSCDRMAAVVGPIINNCSPEGYVPNFEIPENDKALAQKVSLFGWRATKEMSLLLGEIMEKAPLFNFEQAALFAVDLVVKAEAYFLKVFVETKHRGAYEQAHVGFCKFCKKLWEMSAKGYPHNPERWVESVLRLLKGDLEDDHYLRSNLGPTRRSAGLPFLVQAALVSEPKSSQSPVFDNCMTDLLTVAEDGRPEQLESRTHALNILRALFKHNQLNERVVPHVPKGFMVSISGFDEPNWGIRNSSTLLFSALISRTFGVQRVKGSDTVSIKNKMAAKVFFTRYPGLQAFFLDKFKKFAEAPSEHHLGVHPVLLVLSRLYASNTDEENLLCQYLPFMTSCLQLPSLRVRELAAQSSILLMSKRSMASYLSKVLKRLGKHRKCSSNYTHGALLQLKHILTEKAPELKDKAVLGLVRKTFWMLSGVGVLVSHFTSALYLEIIALFVEQYADLCYDSPVFADLSTRLVSPASPAFRGSIPNSTSPTCPSVRAFNRNRFYLHILLMTKVLETDSATSRQFLHDTIFLALKSGAPEVAAFALNYLLSLSACAQDHRPHALLTVGALLPCDLARKAVGALQNREELLQMAVDSIRNGFQDCLQVLLAREEVYNQQLTLLLLYEFPDALTQLGQHALRLLLAQVRCQDDVRACAALGCIGKLIERAGLKERTVDFAPVLKVLADFAVPSASLARRLTVAQLLVCNKYLLLIEHDVLRDGERIELWNVVVALLGDYDRLVRDSVSQIVSKSAAYGPDFGDLCVIPEKARELVVELIPQILNRSTAIRLLISWSLRSSYLNCEEGAQDDEAEISEVFGNVDENPFSEEGPLSELATAVLKQFLWRLEDGLSYEDFSIFVEEHTLLVATRTRNALYKGPIPLVEHQSRCTIVHVCRNLMEFLETREIGAPNFKKDLETELAACSAKYCSSNDPEMRKKLLELLKVVFGLA